MKRRVAFALAVVLGLVLVSALPAVAGKLCKAGIIYADCESFLLEVDSDPGTIYYELIINRDDCLGSGIVVWGSFEHKLGTDPDAPNDWYETIQAYWDDFDLCFGGPGTVRDILIDGRYKITGKATLEDCDPISETCERDIPEVTFDFIDCGPPPPFCESGFKPQMLVIKYTGESCAASSHSQDPKKVKCLGDPQGETSVWIRATDKKGNKVWFEGDVNVGNDWMFEIDAKTETLAGDTKVFIYDEYGETLLQTIQFHTSCSQPLNIGDQFGSLVLVDGIVVPK